MSIGNGYAQSVAGDSINPIYSGTINGNCFMVGNTNTQIDMDADAIITEEVEKGGKNLKNIMNTPGGAAQYYSSVSSTTSNPFTIVNSNYAEFCIEAPSTCGKLNIECARLTWGGRYDTQNSTPPSKVYVKITNNQGQSLTTNNNALKNFIEVKGTATVITSSKNGANDGFYVCHADIGNIITALVTDKSPYNGGEYRIYVANVDAKLANTQVGENAGLFSGWNFTLVYSHPLLQKRSIMVHEGDQFGESQQTGTTPRPIYSNLRFGSANAYSISDTISFSYAAFGGMATQGQEKIVSNKDGLLNENSADTKNYYGFAKTKIPYKIEDCANTNSASHDEAHLRGLINYQYEGKLGCKIHSFISQVRGYDLQKTTLDPGEFTYINKGDSSFNIVITPTTEYHFFTNSLLYIGAPDAPEVALPIEVDETDIEPDKDFTCKLYVKTGNNKNGLTNIEVRVPISEYVDSITSFDISFHSMLTDVTNNGTNNNGTDTKPTITTVNGTTKTKYTADDKVYGWNTTKNATFRGKNLTSLNAYLETIDKENDNYATNKPTLVKTRELIFSFPTLIIPSAIQDTDAITISLTLHTKKDDDPVYNKTLYVGEKPKVVPQAEMNVSDPASKDTSVIESSYDHDIDWDQLKCEGNLNGDSGGSGSGGGGGGGGCKGLNGYSKTQNGIFQKNRTKQVEINIDATGKCTEMPDSIIIHFCDPIKLTPYMIKMQLASV